MKKTLFVLLLSASLSVAEDLTTAVDASSSSSNLFPSGIPVTNVVIGGFMSNGTANDNTATQTTNAITASPTYSDLTTQMATANTWYVSSTHNTNVNGYSTSSDGVIVVSGGPSTGGTGSIVGGIKFTLGDSVSSCSGGLTFSFDVKLTGGNDNKTHNFTFSLMSSDTQKAMSGVYVYLQSSESLADGATKLSSDSATTISLSFTEDQMQDIDANTELVFLVSSTNDSNTGGNKGILMNNFSITGLQAAPEPATASLGLLGLAGLLLRRRRSR